MRTVLRIDPLFIASSSLAALQFGKALPAKFRAACPPVITCGALTAVAVSVLGAFKGLTAAAGIYGCRDWGLGVRDWGLGVRV